MFLSVGIYCFREFVGSSRFFFLYTNSILDDFFFLMAFEESLYRCVEVVCVLLTFFSLLCGPWHMNRGRIRIYNYFLNDIRKQFRAVTQYTFGLSRFCVIGPDFIVRYSTINKFENRINFSVSQYILITQIIL